MHVYTPKFTPPYLQHPKMRNTQIYKPKFTTPYLQPHIYNPKFTNPNIPTPYLQQPITTIPIFTTAYLQPHIYTPIFTTPLYKNLPFVQNLKIQTPRIYIIGGWLNITSYFFRPFWEDPTSVINHHIWAIPPSLMSYTIIFGPYPSFCRL